MTGLFVLISGLCPSSQPYTMTPWFQGMRSRQASGGVETIQKPLVTKDYNQYMGGVDKSDQLVVYCGLRWSSKKWRKRAFFHLMEPTMVNAYILYCYSTPKKERMTHLKFRLDVASRGSSSSTCSTLPTSWCCKRSPQTHWPSLPRTRWWPSWLQSLQWQSSKERETDSVAV